MLKEKKMLLHPTLEKLNTLRFNGMAAALDEQMQMNSLVDLGFEERRHPLDGDGRQTDQENEHTITKGQAAPGWLYRGHQLPPSAGPG
jgi:hypothetical protein